MRIGISLDITQGTRPEAKPLSWESVRAQAVTAEQVGFDVVAVPDGFLLRFDDRSFGLYESVAVAAAVLEATSTIRVAHDMMNTPYRAPALIASSAKTLHDIGDGRYWLGLGAGNTPDSDYRAAGVPADHRYSRFAETVEIVHGLLSGEVVDFDGEYHRVQDSELVLPESGRPPITVGAFKPKTMRLAARFADHWGGYVVGGPYTVDSYRPMLEELELACEEVGRDPDTLGRSVDVPVDPHGRFAELRPDAEHLPITGTSEQIAEAILAFEELGLEELRCETVGLLNDGAATVESMAEVVELVHAGS